MIEELTYVHDRILRHLLRRAGQAVEGRFEVRVGVYLRN